MFKKDSLVIKYIEIFRHRRRRTFISRKSVFFNSDVDERVDIKSDTDVSNSKIGFGTYIGKNCEIKFSTIGKFCSIGNNITLVSNNHPVKNYVSTHPAFHRPNHPLMSQLGLNFECREIYPEYKSKLIGEYRTVIGNDVWIGTNVTIVEGVRIGDGSVIACGSVVTKDVEPYSIVAGVPAKVIKFRFDEKQRQAILNSRWWDWELDRLKCLSHQFNNINDFLETLQ
ncbi:CatB-related O-acetyltransferase [Vibrio cyclitrophicus]